MPGSFGGRLARTALQDFQAAPLAGSVSVTEVNDSLAAASTLAIIATGAASEANDTATASALVPITGARSQAEAGDTLAAAITLVVPIAATAGITETNDTALASATVALSALAGATGPPIQVPPPAF
jgi:hypothetical protein